eukprot:765648_1
MAYPDDACNEPDMSVIYSEASISKIRGDLNSSNTIQQPTGETINTIIESQTKDNLIEQDSSHVLSQTAAFINLCKCFSGASLFAMPWAFSQSGLLSGIISLIFLSFLTYFTLYWLGKCSHLHP